VTRDAAPAADRQQREPVVEPVGHLNGRQRPHSRGCQLDGERYTVQRPADPHDRAGRLGVDGEAWPDGTRAVGEQAHC
jgi:hypothetical protein